MLNLNENYRIEFFGGPSDGEMVYQHTYPDDEYHVVDRSTQAIIIHEYVIQWLNRIQARYIYKGVKVID